VKIWAIAVCSTVLIPAMALASGAPPRAAQFRGDWETGNAKQWGGVERAFERPLSESFNIVTSPVRQGRYAAQFIVRQGYSAWGQNERVEASSRMGDQGPGTEYYYAWSTLFPDNWGPSPIRWGEIVQFYPKLGREMGGGPEVAIDTVGNMLRLKVETGLHSLRDKKTFSEYSQNLVIANSLSKRKWNDFVVHARWETDWTGVLEVWHRVAGEGPLQKVISLRNIPTLRWNPQTGPDAIGALKLGLYRKSFCETPVTIGCTSKLGVQGTNILYHDGFTRGASLDDVVNAAFVQ
jgi:polysaccharide lyase-like protein